jgi:excisionase family DNA binding protein
MDAERYWTPEEIAERLKINVRTVRRWISSKQLKAIRAGKQWRVPDNELRAFIAQSTQEGQQQDTDERDTYGRGNL